MTRQQFWTWYLEAKALIEKRPEDIIILSEVYRIIEIISMTPVGFDVPYANTLVASIPRSYKEDYERYGLHFAKKVA